MQLRRFIHFVLIFSALGGLWAQAACADEAAAIYDPSTVAIVDLTLSAEAEAKLEEKPDKYVKGAFSLTKTSDGTPAGEELTPALAERPVEVRLKGSVGGSFRKLSEKAAFKLKFKEANAVLGLRKMTLNNMVQDPSMVHETLAYAAFRATGVPASRTGFAYLRVNKHDFGLYLNLENLDDIALTRIFGAPFDDETQHLYEGERGNDVFPGGAVGFEIDEGPDDRGDLEGLVAAVNDESGAPFSERLAPHADLIEMGKMWAVEKYIDHWDGYAGHTDQAQAEAHERPNNYYLYSDPSGRFQMLPWGTDQAWIPTIGVGTPGREVTFDGPGGVLFNRCLEEEECFRAYWSGLSLATQAIPGFDPGALAEDIADLLAPWQQEERDNGNGRAEFDANEVDDGVQATLDFAAGRQAEAEAWLAENEPPVDAGAPPISTHSGPATSAISVPDLVPGRFTVANGTLVSRVWVSGAGAVRQRVSISARHGRLRVCTTDEKAERAGPVILRCKLSDAARRRLRKGSLRLRAYTTFVPLGRAGTVAVRNLTAPKDPSL
jgi:hypothetical protein